MAPRTHTQVTTTSWLFLRSLRMSLGRTPLWLMTSFMLLLLALPMALPWADWFDSTLAHRYEPGSMTHSLDETFRQDHAGPLAALKSSSSRSAAALALLALFVGVFAGGGWLQVIIERTRGQSLRRFFYGGSRYFWRFTRLALLTLVLLSGLHWLMYGWPWEQLVLEAMMGVPASDVAELETLDSELFVRRIGWFQDGLAAIGFALIMCWGTYSRARLVLQDGSSAIWAGLCASWTLVRYPIRTLRPLILLLATEAIVVTLVLGTLTRQLDKGLVYASTGEAEGPTGRGWRIGVMALIGIAALLWREVMRGASYHAALQVSREVVPPRSDSDRWKSIGGPGGPQYPTEGGDEYGVAM
ncbi:MAG: hypothetical protein ACI841_002213 [Planctomycetota bacterium]|jgi:hypothetical protein